MYKATNNTKIGVFPFGLCNIEAHWTGNSVLKTPKGDIDSNLSMITEISLDHDLGEGKTGYDAALHLEKLVYLGFLPRCIISCHSMSPVGKERIELCLRKINDMFETNSILITENWLISLGWRNAVRGFFDILNHEKHGEIINFGANGFMLGKHKVHTRDQLHALIN